jgi:hypothetical protein
MCGRHLLKRRPHVLHGQVFERDRPDDGQQRPQRVPVRLDRLGRAPRQPFVQPVGHGLLDRVARRTAHARIQLAVQSLELVLDLGPGLAADFPADPLAVRIKPERDHPAPAPGTGLVMGAVPAVRPVIEVDAVFAVATA